MNLKVPWPRTHGDFRSIRLIQFINTGLNSPSSFLISGATRLLSTQCENQSYSGQIRNTDLTLPNDRYSKTYICLVAAPMNFQRYGLSGWLYDDQNTRRKILTKPTALSRMPTKKSAWSFYFKVRPLKKRYFCTRLNKAGAPFVSEFNKRSNLSESRKDSQLLSHWLRRT